MSGRCGTCRFWSEMIAKSEGSEILAVCLSTRSPHSTKYTRTADTCTAHQPSLYGAIDSPPDYGADARAAYIEDEGPEGIEGKKP